MPQVTPFLTRDRRINSSQKCWKQWELKNFYGLIIQSTNPHSKDKRRHGISDSYDICGRFFYFDWTSHLNELRDASLIHAHEAFSIFQKTVEGIPRIISKGNVIFLPSENFPSFIIERGFQYESYGLNQQAQPVHEAKPDFPAVVQPTIKSSMQLWLSEFLIGFGKTSRILASCVASWPLTRPNKSSKHYAITYGRFMLQS